MILGRPILLGVFLAATWFAYVSPASGQTYGGRELVKAELIADTTAVVPGKPFTVGLLLHMVPGWHTYWKYSGDAGLPTELKWTLPPGWKIGEIQWPIPHRLKDPGDIQTYGYDNEVFLMQEITPPASIDDGTGRIWRPMQPGSYAKDSVSREAQNSNWHCRSRTTNAPANTELFQKYRKQLPKGNWPGKFVRRSGEHANEVSLTVKGDTGFQIFVCRFFSVTRRENRCRPCCRRASRRRSDGPDSPSRRSRPIKSRDLLSWPKTQPMRIALGGFCVRRNLWLRAQHPHRRQPTRGACGRFSSSVLSAVSFLI